MRGQPAWGDRLDDGGHQGGRVPRWSMFNCSFSGRIVAWWGFYALARWEAAKARRERRKTAVGSTWRVEEAPE